MKTCLALIVLFLFCLPHIVEAQASTVPINKLTIRVVVSGDPSYTKDVTNYLTSKFKNLSDVTLVDSREWMTIDCVAVPIKKDDIKSGCVLSFAITSQAIYVMGSYHAYKLPLQAIDKENIDNWFKSNGNLVDHFVKVTSPDKMESDIGDIVTTIDSSDVTMFWRVFNSF
jgi:hypothetical protein